MEKPGTQITGDLKLAGGAVNRTLIEITKAYDRLNYLRSLLPAKVSPEVYAITEIYDDMLGVCEPFIKQAIATMGDSSTRKDEDCKVPLLYLATEETQSEISPATPPIHNDFVADGCEQFTEVVSREIRLLSFTDIEDALIKHAKYLHNPLTESERTLIADILRLLKPQRHTEPVMIVDDPLCKRCWQRKGDE